MTVHRELKGVDELLVSVDVEAGGPVPGLYPLLAIGACPVETSDDRFYAELRPVGERVDPAAVAIGWPAAPAEETIARLEHEGEPPEQAFPRFATWLADRQEGRRLVYVAVNAAFDWAFTHYWFARLQIDDPFGYAPLDIKSYWAGRAGVPLSQTGKSRLPAFLSQGLGEHTHRADEDAARQAEIFKRMRAWTREAASGRPS
jgi:DNA polymerase III epsilon subunit-like protein